MKLSSTFIVPAERATVFDRFLDPGTMKSCIPGCEELTRIDEKHYAGRLVNEIAHVRFAAAFSLEIVDIAPPIQVHAVLQGEDNRLASSMKLDATLLLDADGDERTKVSYQMDLAMWGKLGRLGESIFRRRTADVEREFVERFATACSSDTSDSASPSAASQPAVAEPKTVVAEPGTTAREGSKADGAEPPPVANEPGPIGERSDPAGTRPASAAEPATSARSGSPSSGERRPWWRRLAGWFSGLVGRR